MNHNTLPIHPYLTDPRTGVPLQAVGIGKRGPIWPIMGASQPAPDPPAPAPPAPPASAPTPTPSSPAPPTPASAPAPTPQPEEKGFPENTPIEQMTDGQQAAYWKHHSRRHEQVAKSRGDYDELKRKAEEYDKHQAANATEHEKAVKAAADAAREAERQALTPQLVAAEFKAAAAGRISAEQLTTILEPLDMSKFLDATGAVDTAKVATFVNGIAPQQDPKKRPFPDLGQGRRPGSPGPSVSAGRDMYAEQQKNRPTAPSGASNA